MDGARFAKLPEGEFYTRIQTARQGSWGNKEEQQAKELYLKWWKLVIASRTLSQKALEEQWRLRQAEKVRQEEEETRQDKEVQRLMRLPGIAAAPTGA